MIVIDAVVRLLPGVMGNKRAIATSFEPDCWSMRNTQPRFGMGLRRQRFWRQATQKIAKWRLAEAERETRNGVQICGNNI